MLLFLSEGYQWQERELDYNGLNSFLDEKQVLDLLRHEETKIN